jgi:hypothetical protein
MCNKIDGYFHIEYDMSNICDDDVNTQTRRQLRSKSKSNSEDAENPLEN